VFIQDILCISKVTVVTLFIFLRKWLIFRKTKWIYGKSTVIKAEMENHLYGDGCESSYVWFSDYLVLACVLM